VNCDFEAITPNIVKDDELGCVGLTASSPGGGDAKKGKIESLHRLLRNSNICIKNFDAKY